MEHFAIYTTIPRVISVLEKVVHPLLYFPMGWIRMLPYKVAPFTLILDIKGGEHSCLASHYTQYTAQVFMALYISIRALKGIICENLI